MRVKISYGTDIEKVPSIITDIGNSAIKDLKSALNILTRAVEGITDYDDYSVTLTQLNHIDEKLKLTALSIQDLQAILGGLENYYQGEEDVSNRRPTVDTSGDAVDSGTNQ